jgi:hypothetical protein
VRFDGKLLAELKRDGTARLRFSVGNGARLYSFSIR